MNNSEDCLSNLLKIVQPFSFYDGTTRPLLENLLNFKYSHDEVSYNKLKIEYLKIFENQYKDSLSKFKKEISIFENSLKSVENYILDF